MTEQQIKQIITELLNGDSRNFGKIVQLYYTDCRRFFINRKIPFEQVEELANDALLKWYEQLQLGKFTHISKGITKIYIINICNNLAKNFHKKEKKRKENDEDAQLEYQKSRENNNDNSDEKLRHLALWLAIDSIEGKNCREIMEASYRVENRLSLKSIAKKFGYASDKSASETKRRCEKKLTFKTIEIYNQLKNNQTL